MHYNQYWVLILRKRLALINKYSVFYVLYVTHIVWQLNTLILNILISILQKKNYHIQITANTSHEVHIISSN